MRSRTFRKKKPKVVPMNSQSLSIGALSAVVLAASASVTPVLAQPGRNGGYERGQVVGISGSSHDERVDCRGGMLQVSGSSNRIRAAGPCNGVAVSGSSNRIFVDLIPNSRVDLSGSSNVIEYRIAPGAPDAIVRQSGSSNIVERRP
jgi:hypothetical protein